jgi:hypothetical protein
MTRRGQAAASGKLPRRVGGGATWRGDRCSGSTGGGLLKAKPVARGVMPV